MAALCDTFMAVEIKESIYGRRSFYRCLECKNSNKWITNIGPKLAAISMVAGPGIGTFDFSLGVETDLEIEV